MTAVTVAVGADPAAWIQAYLPDIRDRLVADGVVRLSGAAVRSADDVAAAGDALFAAGCPRLEPFAARPDGAGRVAAAPVWPAERDMCPHNEQAHASVFPRTLLLAMPEGAGTDGATLLADGAAVWRELDTPIRDRLAEQGWMLVRNYRPYVGMRWTEALGVTDPAEVVAHCAAAGVTASWAGATLHTRQRRPAFRTHPLTGVPCWFNLICFLSQWSLRDEEREVLLGAYGPEGLPFNTFFGDGTPIAQPEWAHLQAVVDAYTVRQRWTPGDLLIVDNIRTSHGRTAHDGTWPLLEMQGDRDQHASE
ncbi:TauD/TfdA family dioxygenase [Paractinoplanes hotanensis]|uniref:TauD/TfdA family dioxygenase n=1 Tax=Paractinoplanes hotanensis TaxID=2906497 RepID=A0ABT0YAP0_9ACTN|nr:TauD/TfdA family dioxygenase [Actinoplanes hotanensis]MCM4083106.1 TauD/TfdA family dioxygenase [Actinoplanes hotanensis]